MRSCILCSSDLIVILVNGMDRGECVLYAMCLLVVDLRRTLLHFHGEHAKYSYFPGGCSRFTTIAIRPLSTIRQGSAVWFAHY